MPTINPCYLYLWLVFQDFQGICAAKYNSVGTCIFLIFKLTSYNCCWPHEIRKFRRKITQQKHKRKWKESGKNTTECRNLIFFRYYISYSIICINFSINDIYEWVTNGSMTKYIKKITISAYPRCTFQGQNLLNFLEIFSNCILFILSPINAIQMYISSS